MLNKLLGRKAPATDLPVRVRREIEESQDRSEVLIGWLQLGVVLTFAVLYLLAPDPRSGTLRDNSACLDQELMLPLELSIPIEPGFALEPWAIGIYLLLTVVRLIWASRARLPTWSLFMSIVFDVALLMVLIWSFHLKYCQPASFYLKAPTMLYVFIFIALRALRFDFRWVALAGLMAAAGWGALILYVINVDPTDTMITKNYVDYLTSNSILLGAEFDKIVSILVVTAILAVALQRAYGLLVRSVAEQTAAQDLSRFFAPEVAARIKGSDQAITAGSGELREAAILNLDLRGFTKLAETLPPDRVMGLLAQYQSLMVPVIQKHGGSIDKFLGDGIMATFGASAPSETYAADALRACTEALEVAAAWRRDCQTRGEPCPEVNAAVATGRILFGAVGDETRLEYTVIGDAVNLSAKLEKHNKTLGVRGVCDAGAYKAALAQGFSPKGAAPERGSATVEGVGHPVELVVLAR